jgi:hypothetical protein
MKTATRAFPAALVFALAALTPTVRAADQESGPEPAAAPPAQQGVAPRALLKLVLLKPSIHFEDMPNAVVWLGLPNLTLRRGVTAGPEAYEQVLLDAAKKGVAAKVALQDTDTLSPSVLDACKKLEPLASRLARGHFNQEAMEGLAALDEQFAILAQFFRVETGPGRSWNPNTGQITSSSASTLIQAALVSGKTGKVLWKGERLIRYKALKPTDPALSKALTALYQDFEIQ